MWFHHLLDPVLYVISQLVDYIYFYEILLFTYLMLDLSALPPPPLQLSHM